MPDSGLDTLIAQGAIALVCNLAMKGAAGIIARRANKKAGEVEEELHNGLVPGVTRVPSGVFTLIRSKQAGCNYLRSTWHTRTPVHFLISGDSR